MHALLRGLALFLILGAILAAFVGYRLSSKDESEPKPPPIAEQTPQETLVVRTARPIAAGHAIVADDVELAPVALSPAGSFILTQQVIGQVPAMDVAPGEILTHYHFKFDNPLLRSLYAGERAMAIKVDEVAGLVGFVKPGDRVDVLLYLRAAQETDQVSSAQVVLRNARLLAYGEDAGKLEGAEDAAGDGAKDGIEKAGEKVVAPKRPQPRRHSSAVLAFPEKQVSRLMLAASSGSLRLVLRPLLDEDEAPEGEAGAVQKVVDAKKAEADETQFEPLSDLAQVKKGKKTAAGKTQPVPRPVPSVIIQEGDNVRRVNAPSF